MADHLDVDTDVLRAVAAAFDEHSRVVDELTVPSDIDAGIATGDVLLLLAELSYDLGEIAGGMDAMARQVAQTRQLYLDHDADAAEAIFRAGTGR